MSKQKLNTGRLVLSRTQVRRVDQIAIEGLGIPGVVLMENAGRGCVEQMLRRGVGGAVVICCGPGNNGGDGFVMARHLDVAGVDVKIILVSLATGFAGDARTNLQIVQKMEVPIVNLAELPIEDWQRELQSVSGRPTEWVVDALLGTGATGPPRPPLDQLIKTVNSMSVTRIAIDIPTGMDCDTGVCHEPVFRAGMTCTFVAQKPAFANQYASQYIGEVHVIDIGVPHSVIRQVIDE